MELRTTLQAVKRARVSKKAIATKVALSVALELFEKIVKEIEKLKADEGGVSNKTSP